MTTDSGADHRAYQRLLIDQANAEMGRQRISRRKLMRMTGIPDATMNRIFTCERDMNVAQWDAIASALGFDPSDLAMKARGEVVPPRNHPEPPSGGDPRSLITWLIDNPDRDAELATRLGDVDTQVALSGRQRSALRDTVRAVRREELLSALDALPPSAEQGGSQIG